MLLQAPVKKSGGYARKRGMNGKHIYTVEMLEQAALIALSE
jgi:hypothetical protein